MDKQKSNQSDIASSDDPGVSTRVGLVDPLLDKTDEEALDVLADRYKLLQRVGTGGMGEVYKSLDQQTGDICAVKVMHAHLSGHSTNVRRFEREALVAVNLKHENIVAVRDFGLTETNKPFIVMEYLEGKSFSDVLEESKPPLNQILSILINACRGLSHAHQCNVVHRDIKPSNIMLIENKGSQVVKIVDFGIAKVCKTSGEICPTTSSVLHSLTSLEALNQDEMNVLETLTQPGEVFGSPLYMSPEQCRGEEVDCRSEVYSFGCLMFEALTGIPPLKGRNALETIFQRISYSAPPIREVRPDLNFSPELDAIVTKALNREPDERFQSMSELMVALEGLERN